MKAVFFEYEKFRKKNKNILNRPLQGKILHYYLCMKTQTSIGGANGK